MNSHVLIVADENIPYVKEAFEPLGIIRLVSGRSLTSSAIKDAHILLVRSVTHVNRELLEGSSVRFVGTATAGIDHLDVEYLQARGIEVATAQGSNANSVAEYVMTALLIVARRQGLTLSGKKIGIVGVGHIGRIVQAKAEALGMTAVLNDPPLAQMTGEKKYRPLEEALDCHVVTLHVPLICEHDFRTYHLLNRDNLAQLNPSTILINTSRGEVVETLPLLNLLQTNSLGAVVLDVWEHEPDINWELFKLVNLGTPHIAGYSLDGKAQGTFMIYQALCTYLGLEPTWRPSHALPAPERRSVTLATKGQTSDEILCDLTTRIYDLEADHGRMCASLQSPPATRPIEFDRLRKSYPVRREFHNTNVKLVDGNPELERMVRGLGFRQEGRSACRDDEKAC